MLLINSYCPSFFPSLFHLSRTFSALFPVALYPFFALFPPQLKLVLSASINCILPIFLSVTFLTFSHLFRPFFRRIYVLPHMLLLTAYWTSFFPPLFSPFPPLYGACNASNKCILYLFLFVPFRALLALFSSIFTPHFALACTLIINAYYPSFFPPLFHPSRAFSAFFRRFLFFFASIFTSLLKLALHASYKYILAIFLSVTFLALLPPFPLFFPSCLNTASPLLIMHIDHLSFRHFSHLPALFPPFFRQTLHRI
jgi:hypothetical protein